MAMLVITRGYHFDGFSSYKSPLHHCRGFSSHVWWSDIPVIHIPMKNLHLSHEITIKSHWIPVNHYKITITSIKSHEITIKSHEITIKSHEITIKVQGPPTTQLMAFRFPNSKNPSTEILRLGQSLGEGQQVVSGSGRGWDHGVWCKLHQHQWDINGILMGFYSDSTGYSWDGYPLVN